MSIESKLRIIYQIMRNQRRRPVNCRAFHRYRPVFWFGLCCQQPGDITAVMMWPSHKRTPKCLICSGATKVSCEQMWIVMNVDDWERVILLPVERTLVLRAWSHRRIIKALIIGNFCCEMMCAFPLWCKIDDNHSSGPLRLIRLDVFMCVPWQIYCGVVFQWSAYIYAGTLAISKRWHHLLDLKSN